MRDYEVVKVEQDVPNEFLLVFDEGNIKVEVQSTAAAGAPNARARELRGRGAYYKNIERKMVLKKKRTEVRGVLSLVAPLALALLSAARTDSRPSASATSGRSCASRTRRRAARRRRSARRRWRRSSIRCTSCNATRTRTERRISGPPFLCRRRR